jgi:hypothetical protein
MTVKFEHADEDEDARHVAEQAERLLDALPYDPDDALHLMMLVVAGLIADSPREDRIGKIQELRQILKDFLGVEGSALQ